MFEAYLIRAALVLLARHGIGKPSASANQDVPEVDKIKMMCRLVYQKTATVSLIAMPSTEVIGSVACVQHPLEVNAGDLSNGARSDQLGYLGVVRCVTIVERNPNLIMSDSSVECSQRDAKGT